MPSLGAAFQHQPDTVREQPEAYQSVLIWQPVAARPTGARAALTKAPIIRDVPQVRRKLTSRNSTSGPRFDPNLATPSSSSTTDRSIVSTIIRPTQNWLREKPSRAKLAAPAVSNVHASGMWKRGTLHFRDNSNLLIYSEEHALLHSIACEDLSTTHIRKIDSSLFGKNHAMGIFAQPSTLTQLSPRSRSNTTHSDEPIYLCFFSRAALHKWLYLLRICAQPELYGSPLTVARGGTHRFYRQLDMTINGVRFFSPTAAAESGAHLESLLLPNSAGLSSMPRPSSAAPGGDRDFDLPGVKEEADMQCYCVVRSGSYAIARTKVFATTSNQLWLENFSVGDLAPWSTLTVELMQAQRGGKSAMFGVVDLTVQTMRRGETIDGWFPIWSTARAAREGVPIATSADAATAYSRELIGELKLVLHLREEVIMPRKRYNEVSTILNSDKFIPLVSALTKVVDEQSVIGHLVDVFASSGTIVTRIADLTQAETDALSEGFELELLFRGNSLLSRSLDKYQRTYCTEWLFDSIGGFILNICEQRVVIETPLAHDDGTGASSAAGAGTGGNLGPGSGDGDVRFLDQAETIFHLKQWTKTLWQSIYGARDKCPPDLRRILSNIRQKVDAKFANQETTAEPGKQAVSAFAFLRLICPAIATPHLYGILPSAPEPRTSRILKMLAKIILSLANRRSGFEKDTWLAPMTDFLKTQANLYDDYINTISTEPTEVKPTTYVPFGDEDDTTFAQCIQDKISRLYPIHRESIPSVNFAMDEPLALATFTSYVARNVPAELVDEDTTVISSGDGTAQLDLNALGEQGDLLRRFTRHACNVEEHAGYYVDKAGYDAQPLVFVDRSIKHHNLTSSLATVSVGKTSTPVSLVSPRQVAKTSPGRRRGATVSASASGGSQRDNQRIPPSISDEDGIRERDAAQPVHSAIMSADYGTQYDSDEELRAAYRTIKEHDGPGEEGAGANGAAAAVAASRRPHSSEGTVFATIGQGYRRDLADEASLLDDDGSVNGNANSAGGGPNADSSVTSLPRYGTDSRRSKKWWKIAK